MVRCQEKDLEMVSGLQETQVELHISSGSRGGDRGMVRDFFEEKMLFGENKGKSCPREDLRETCWDGACINSSCYLQSSCLGAISEGIDERCA